MYFIPQALGEAFEECGTAAENNVLKQVFADVGVALHHRVVAVVVDAFQLVAALLRLEQDFGAFKSLFTN